MRSNFGFSHYNQEMTNNYRYTLESALRAHKKGQLFQWTQDYLHGEGQNRKLAEHLTEKRPASIELVEFPLSKLKRVMGPEKGMAFTESEELWEKRVNQLIRRVKEGQRFPPLIVTDLWKDLEISDGSHRQEALLRCGYKKYWTAFFFYKKTSKKGFAARDNPFV